MMRPINKKESIVHLLEEVCESFKRLMPGYNCTLYVQKISEDEDFYSVLAPEFSLFFSAETSIGGKFFLTFKVGTTGAQSARITKILCTTFYYDELIILADSYYDYEKEKLVFGVEAIELKSAEMREATGRKKCPVCDSIYKKKYFDEHGICINCKEQLPVMIWN
jgi:hypothetical protein